MFFSSILTGIPEKQILEIIFTHPPVRDQVKLVFFSVYSIQFKVSFDSTVICDIGYFMFHLVPNTDFFK